MGTYGLSPEEISDILVTVEDEGWFDGDFSEEDLLQGAKLFCKKLRENGADIPKGDALHESKDDNNVKEEKNG